MGCLELVITVLSVSACGPAYNRGNGLPKQLACGVRSRFGLESPVRINTWASGELVLSGGLKVQQLTRANCRADMVSGALELTSRML